MRRKNKRILQVLGSLVAIGVVATFAVVWRPSLAIEFARPDLPAPQIAKGSQLAAIGNCITCHTKDGGALLCRRSPDRDAVWHRLLDQRDARPRHRHRQLVGGGVPL